MATSKAEQGAASKRRILEAGVRLFSEHGYEHSGIQQISIAAGVSRGSIFWHFGSKEGLLLAVVEHCFSTWESEVVGPLLGDGSGPESIAHVLRAHFAFVRGRPVVARLLFVMLFEGMASQPALLERYRALHERIRGFGRAWIERAIAAGRIRADVDPEAASSALLGALAGAHYQWLLDPERIDLDAVEAALERILARGLAPA